MKANFSSAISKIKPKLPGVKASPKPKITPGKSVDVTDVVAETVDTARVQAGRELLKTKCFARDTLVSTSAGLRPIGEINVGELVHSFDFESGEWKQRTVTDRIDSIYEGPVVTIVTGTDETGTDSIETTIHHPFWVVQGHELSHRTTPRELAEHEDQDLSLRGRWVNSHELLAGDVIIGKDGTQRRITGISQRYKESFPVSNLTIGEYHNYSVGTLSILVHNLSVCDMDAIKDLLDEGFSPEEIRASVQGFENADEVGEFLSRSLHRPSLREGTKAAIEANAAKNAAGEFIDSRTGKVLDDWHYGHNPGHENRRLLAAAEELGLSQSQLNNYVNARPDYFKIEDAARNLSHVDEIPGKDQLGPILRDMRNFFRK